MFQLLVNNHMSQVDMKLIYPLSLIIFIIFGVFNYAIGKKIVLPFHVLLVKTLLVLCKKRQSQTSHLKKT